MVRDAPRRRFGTDSGGPDADPLTSTTPDGRWLNFTPGGLSGERRVRRDGAKAAIADLKTGDAVRVMSKVEASGTTAYLVVVPKN